MIFVAVTVLTDPNVHVSFLPIKKKEKNIGRATYVFFFFFGTVVGTYIICLYLLTIF